MTDASNLGNNSVEILSAVGFVVHSPFILMLSIGLFGGWLSWLNADYDEAFCKRRLFRNLITGMLATFMVPLFLQMIGSNLLVEISPDYSKFYVFLGMCSAAAFVSQKFASSISDKMLQQATEKADSASKSAQQATAKTLSIEIEQLKLQGSLHMIKKEYEEALLLMEEYLKHNSRDPGTLFRKAFCLKRVGRVSRALKEINLAIEYSKKPSALLYFNKACYMALLKKPIDEIISVLSTGLIIDEAEIKSAIMEELKLSEQDDSEDSGDFDGIKEDVTFIGFLTKSGLSIKLD